jgi:hypothetical protein
MCFVVQNIVSEITPFIDVMLRYNSYIHTNYPGNYQLHGGSIYIYIYITLRPAFLIYINIRTLPLKYKVVSLTSHKRQATIPKVG